MKSDWHIMIVTSLSMLITLTTNCILEQMKANHSVVQEIVDLIHASILTMTCSFQDRYNFTICADLLLTNDNNGYAIDLFMITFILIILVLLCYGQQMLNYIRMIIYTFLFVWLLSRYCNNQICWYQIDMLTVYFLIWQFMYVMCKWEFYELSWPLLIFQQASSCVSTSITVFFLYDILYRYIPFQFKIAFLWLFSLYDIVTCLYINGRLRKLSLGCMSKGVIIPDSYCTYDIEDENEEDDNNTQGCIGLGDFTVYNLMILSIMNPVWSITTNIFVAFGCIVCIQVGYYSMILISEIWNEHTMPGLPFPVISFSIYTIIIDFMMNYTSNDCANL